MASQDNKEIKMYAGEYHVIRDDDTFLAYDVENVRLIKLKGIELRVLNNIREKPASLSELKKRLPDEKNHKLKEAVAELIRVNMLDYSPFKEISQKEIKNFERKHLEKLRKTGLKQISLNVTHKCNLHCDYCYGEDGSYGGPAVHMSRDTARQAVDFLMKESGSDKICRITFFGGEPLLNFDLVKYVVKYARNESSKRNKELHLGMTSNGILMNDDKADFLIKEKIEVTFSIDGPKEIQDNNRRLKGNKEQSSYDLVYPKILKYIEKAEKNNSFYAFRATLTRPALINMYDVVDFFHGFKTKKIIYDTAEYKHGISPRGLAITEDDLNIYRQKVKEVAEGFRKKHSKYDSLFSGPLNAIKKKTRRNNYCLSAGILYVGVSAQGDLFPCHRFVGYKGTKLGNVWEGFDKEDWQRRYAKVHIFNSKVCSRCWIRYYCGGLCPATNYFLGGDMVLSEKVDPEPVHCKLKKIIFEETLLLSARLWGEHSQAETEDWTQQESEVEQCV